MSVHFCTVVQKLSIKHMMSHSHDVRQHKVPGMILLENALVQYTPTSVTLLLAYDPDPKVHNAPHHCKRCHGIVGTQRDLTVLLWHDVVERARADRTLGILGAVAAQGINMASLHGNLRVFAACPTPDVDSAGFLQQAVGCMAHPVCQAPQGFQAIANTFAGLKFCSCGWNSRGSWHKRLCAALKHIDVGPSKGIEGLCISLAKPLR